MLENKAALYNELRIELATKEFVRAEIKEVKLLMRVMIGIMIFGFTLFNPSFIQIVQMILK